MVGNAPLVRFLNHIGTKGCLVLGIVQKGEGRHCSSGAGGLEALVKAVGVVADGVVGSGEDLRCGAVVLFQLDDVGAGKFLGKLQDVLHLRPPEAVDGLVVVAHHTDIGLWPHQLAQQPELGHVGVLVLVHHDNPEASVHVLANEAILLHQFYRQHDEVAKVDVARLPQPLLVGVVGLWKKLRGIDVEELRGVRLPAVVLGTGNLCRQGLCLLPI